MSSLIYFNITFDLINFEWGNKKVHRSFSFTKCRIAWMGFSKNALFLPFHFFLFFRVRNRFSSINSLVLYLSIGYILCFFLRCCLSLFRLWTCIFISNYQNNQYLAALKSLPQKLVKIYYQEDS